MPQIRGVTEEGVEFPLNGHAECDNKDLLAVTQFRRNLLPLRLPRRIHAKRPRYFRRAIIHTQYSSLTHKGGGQEGSWTWNMEHDRRPQMLGNATCYLATLPAELLDMVVFELDSIRDLANFIITSRVVYQRFKAQKKAVLLTVLHNELGPVMADARFLQVCHYTGRGKTMDLGGYCEETHIMARLYARLRVKVDEGLQHRRNDAAFPLPGTVIGICPLYAGSSS